MEFFVHYRKGDEWQEIDEAHCCKYCALIEYNQQGKAFCRPLQDALDGFTFADMAELPDLSQICNDYELNHYAFWQGEKCSPLDEGFHCGTVSHKIVTNPLIENIVQ